MSSVPIGSRLGAWGNAEASLSGFYIYDPKAKCRSNIGGCLAATSAAGNLAELNLKFDSREIKTENSMLEPVLTVLTMATPAWQPDPRKPETMRPKKPRALSGR